MKSARWLAWTFFALFTFIAGCKSQPTHTKTEVDPTLVSAFTSGVISRESPIRVQFLKPVVENAAVGKALKSSPFKFTPSIEGDAIWTDARELEFRPKDRLKDGVRYQAELPYASIMKTVSSVNSALFFDFAAMSQSISLQIDGLTVIDPQNPKVQRLSGALVTSDVERPADLEKVLTANHGTTALKIKWFHPANRKDHRFTIDGIVRADKDTEIALVANGAAIGVDKTDSRTIAVPSLNNFRVEEARAVQGADTHIELRFSDYLKPKQNLAGLIKVGNHANLKFVVEKNRVRIYSARTFNKSETVTIDASVKNNLGYTLRTPGDYPVSFESPKPEVRFATKGVIVPSTLGLTIPVEVVNVRSLVVEAMQIYQTNIPQFLQVNDLNGSNELRRVGRPVWRKTVPLDIAPNQKDRWVRVGLDLTGLVKSNPAGLYRLQLSFKRQHVIYECASNPDEEQAKTALNSEANNGEDADSEPRDASFWDYWENSEDNESVYCGDTYQDPCNSCFYRPWGEHNVSVGRNVLLSDIGLIGKRGNDDSLTIIATNLKTAAPMPNVAVKIIDYQQQVLAQANTGADGMARLTTDRKPFVAIAHHDSQLGYLKLDDGAALSISHFDTGGANIAKGLKGFIYGERGVWRPGDTIHLTFMLHDAKKRLPADHPLHLDLVNSRGQLVHSLTRTQSTNGFYTFDLPTLPDWPTGNYLARVTIGGATFEQTLKVETVVPNRLKIGLDFGKKMLTAGDKLNTKLTAAWLHGAIAKGLNAEVEVNLRPTATHFAKYTDFTFDDPTRRFDPVDQNIFDGQLDDHGNAAIDAKLEAKDGAPGMLSANFVTRVYEPGGAFSSDRFSIPFSPYQRYIGMRVPKGDVARGMLVTDTKHEVRIVALNSEGNPAGPADVEMRLYKINWRWWWEKGEESLADYVSSSSYHPLVTENVKLGADGTGAWKFEIKYPEWGRYLIVARDQQGNHSAGQIVYIDWPGWAGRAQKDVPGGASVLSVSADKSEYAVGETVTLTFPTPTKSRALVSLESGSQVVQAAWVESKDKQTKYTFTATAAMAPNVYANVTLLQPHLQTNNDLPIRLYGIAPIKVVDENTQLKPIIEAPEVYSPAETGHLSVREERGRPMTYTVAVVDEGLLALTRFPTPDPWNYFYSREALGVKTWDVFDLVAGAYGATLDRMLAIGGDGSNDKKGGQRANRFPPLVRFMGPFTLGPGQKADHAVDIPQYVGAVRIMVVAGQRGAYGNAQKSVFVRKPLMLLATLPRVLGPEEEVDVPVSVFAMDASVKKVTVTATASGPLALVGAAKQEISFKSPGDQLVRFKAKVKQVLGTAALLVQATSGQEKAEQRIEIEVRMPSLRVAESIGTALEAGKTWEQEIKLVGVAGTNQAMLEVSRIPPLNLNQRLQYLIAYPHGCIEQTTSSVFPQLYLSKLMELNDQRKAQIEQNIRAGIERLRSFQTADGGFAYWPGNGAADEWGSSYAGHFLVEAKRAGYAVPPNVLDGWKNFQRTRARSFGPTGGHSDLEQAYRLYTLALFNAPELGAMNQLREKSSISNETRYRLAAAYAMAGQQDVAATLANQNFVVKPYRELNGTYGSALRDQAMALETLWLIKEPNRAQPLMQDISKSLSSPQWLSTQETSYALIAMARVAEQTEGNQRIDFTVSWEGGSPQPLNSSAAILEHPLPISGQQHQRIVVVNKGNTMLFPRVIVSGIPALGSEKASSSGLQLSVDYTTTDGTTLEPDQIDQGTDFIAVVSVTNQGERGKELHQIALTQMVASGWEIHNDRLDNTEHAENSPSDYRDIRDDRVNTYFSLKPGETKKFTLLLNASYLGNFYLPMVNVEAMYDASIHARLPGRWVKVVNTET